MNVSNYKVDKTALVACYHCGESCKSEIIHFDDKSFCCDGCKLVYDLLKENNLCTYYNLNDSPGVSPVKITYSGKYDYLNNEAVSSKLIHFKDEKQTHITLYIPKINCSSCIWLLENLHRLNEGIISSKVNFLKKETTIIFDHSKVKLSTVADLLASIAYEPLIHLNDLEKETKPTNNRNQIIKIGIAGFCFGNIMMLSFPEYFSVGNFYDLKRLNYFFGYLNLFLSLPVFFYSASGFFESAWKSIRYRYLNIDAPIALAIFVTFSRSVYEIISHTGAGYMDSMTGIVFFMLLGRYFQNKTYDTLSFERDYKSYFPVGVTAVDNIGNETSVPVSTLKKGDKIVIRNNELIPSDSILQSKQTHVDYSFITGESAPVKKLKGELIYAGAKQIDGAATFEVVTPVSQSYLTQLWNNGADNRSASLNQSYVDKINKYFTIAVLSVSFLSASYWFFVDPSKALNALTAVLIVACPCGLLLTSTFASGNVLRILGNNKFYLKNATTINKLANINTILFDKTGTLTHGSTIDFVGPKLKDDDLKAIVSLASQSSHPLSKKISINFNDIKKLAVSRFEDITGKGIKGEVDGKQVILGSEYFVTGSASAAKDISSKVFVMIDGLVIGFFSFNNAYREGLDGLVNTLSKDYKLKLISGDNDAEKNNLAGIFGSKTDLFFNMTPEDKMKFVEQQKQQGAKVMMIGDGLNDAGALTHSDIGIAVSDDTNNFSPACDAIIDGSVFNKLPSFIRLAKANKKVVITTFCISLIYNIIGVSFAVQGTLSPVVAAILMPTSSISIVLLATVSTTVIAKLKRL